MGLQLDRRRIHMLKEMGISVWLPEPQTPRPLAKNSPDISGLHESAQRIVRQPLAVQSLESRLPPAAAKEITPKPAYSPLPDHVSSMEWSELESTAKSCKACGLCEQRHQVVVGQGSTQAAIFILGDAPGENEDSTGQPFAGKAGQLLDNMLAAMRRPAATDGSQNTKSVGLRREQDVYITNTIKCRPPANRNPETAELLSCQVLWQRQIALVQPKLILALGRFAAEALLNHSKEPIGKLRGRVHHYQHIPVVVSYHPGYLLRTPTDKAKAWADLCLAQSVLEQ